MVHQEREDCDRAKKWEIELAMEEVDNQLAEELNSSELIHQEEERAMKTILSLIEPYQQAFEIHHLHNNQVQS